MKITRCIMVTFIAASLPTLLLRRRLHPHAYSTAPRRGFVLFSPFLSSPLSLSVSVNCCLGNMLSFFSNIFSVSLDSTRFHSCHAVHYSRAQHMKITSGSRDINLSSVITRAFNAARPAARPLSQFVSAHSSASAVFEYLLVDEKSTRILVEAKRTVPPLLFSSLLSLHCLYFLVYNPHDNRVQYFQ